MDVERAAEELTERKVLRRGLITGLAGLGAAVLVKLSGAEKAEAHDIQDVGLGSANPTSGSNPTTSTIINANVSANPGFMVVNGGSTPSGKSGIVGVTDANAGGGVRGYNDNNSGFGVIGLGSGNGTGIKGISNASNFT